MSQLLSPVLPKSLKFILPVMAVLTELHTDQLLLAIGGESVRPERESLQRLQSSDVAVKLGMDLQLLGDFLQTSSEQSGLSAGVLLGTE